MSAFNTEISFTFFLQKESPSLYNTRVAQTRRCHCILRWTNLDARTIERRARIPTHVLLSSQSKAVSQQISLIAFFCVRMLVTVLLETPGWIECDVGKGVVYRIQVKNLCYSQHRDDDPD